MSELKLGQHIQIKIDRLSVGGRGVGRHENIVGFIERVAPDDFCEVKITSLKKNFFEAELQKIIEPSTHRVTPPCPYWNDCGGCSWQHIKYSEQLAQKTALVGETLRKFGGYKDVKVEECLPSPLEFRYRNRIQVQVQNQQLGYFKRNSHQLVPIEDCLIADEKIVQQFAKFRGKTGRFEIKADEGPETTFSQVNTGQNANLIREVTEAADKVLKRARFTAILDLYSGNGNLSIPLHESFPTLDLVGVELETSNVQAAKLRTSKKNVQFVESRVEAYVNNLKDLSHHLVVLDPPRAGCGTEIMRSLVQKKAREIIYVSCNPASLARDLKVLSESGFRLEKVQPLDMFPQTDHIECIVVATVS